MSENRSVADGMRSRLGFYLNLMPTPLGVKCAEQERDALEKRIRESLSELTAIDVFMVSTIVGALSDTRVL